MHGAARNALPFNVNDSFEETASGGGAVRLQKFIADAGICSRRAAEALIAQGEVWVNGRQAVQGQKVTPGVDKVTVGGRIVRTLPQPRITLAVNKPRGPRLLERRPAQPRHDIHAPAPGILPLPVLLRRPPGQGQRGPRHPDDRRRPGPPAHAPLERGVKRYYVTAQAGLPRHPAPRLVKGLTFEGERLKVERAALVNPAADGTGRDLDVHMHHGKKREIRLLFSALGYTVQRLRRYQIGAVRLKGIPLRGAKQLASKEIEQLFRSPTHAERRAPGDRTKRTQLSMKIKLHRLRRRALPGAPRSARRP